jgi:hypothetical protein
MRYKKILEEIIVVIGCLVLAFWVDQEAITYVPRANTLINHGKIISLIAVFFFIFVQGAKFIVLKLKEMLK